MRLNDHDFNEKTDELTIYFDSGSNVIVDCSLLDFNNKIDYGKNN